MTICLSMNFNFTFKDSYCADSACKTKAFLKTKQNETKHFLALETRNVMTAMLITSFCGHLPRYY